MGPNGSGKSTLAKVLAGHPDYHVTKGEVTMDGENVLALEPDERARKGLFLAFQYPSKRGEGQRLIPLEDLRANERIDVEPADPVTAEMIYERRWALTVLEQVLNRLKGEYATAGNAALFDSLKQLLPDEPGSPSQAEIAAQLGMTENALRQAFYRFRQRYQSLLREEIAHTVATPGDIEDELRHLIAVLEA
jgi:ABC-type branched-subunit amino acid transport system ATPase component